MASKQTTITITPAKDQKTAAVFKQSISNLYVHVGGEESKHTSNQGSHLLPNAETALHRIVMARKIRKTW